VLLLVGNASFKPKQVIEVRTGGMLVDVSGLRVYKDVVGRWSLVVTVGYDFFHFLFENLT